MIEERKMNLSNSGNVGIISLMASLESNSKEIAKELNRDVQKITDNFIKEIDDIISFKEKEILEV